MTQDKSNKRDGQLQAVLIDDKNFLKEKVKKVCQRIMEEEMTEFLRADPHERTYERQGYRNGYKPRILAQESVS